MIETHRHPAVLGLALACACRAPSAPAVQQLASWDDGAIHVTGAPQLDGDIARALAPYADTAGWRLFALSDDGAKLLVGRRGELFELDGPGAEPRAIAADGHVRWATYAERSIVTATDRDGDERVTLARDGVVIAEAVAEPVANDGMLAWARHVDGGRRTELWRDGERAFVGDGSWAPLDVSHDGHWMLAKHVVAPRTSAIYELDLETGESKALTPTDRRAAVLDAQFGVQGSVFAIADLGGDLLDAVELRHGTRLPHRAGQVDELAVASLGELAAFHATRDGASSLHVWDGATDRPFDDPEARTLEVASDLRGASYARVFAFSTTSWRSPRQVWMYDARDKTLRSCTPAGVLPDAIEPEHAVVASFDATPVRVDLYALRGERSPVVVELHGGPEDSFRPRWQPLAQFLVARGYAVVQPNVRGSSGYGARFAALDDGPHREDAVRDVGAVLDWIATRAELDASRVFVLGTSYGGYLALSSLARYPERLRGGIVLSAITDFVAFLEGTRADRRDDRRAEYGDERDPVTRAFLHRISPASHVAEIRAPLLVAHGRRDPRVPIDATDRFIAALRAAGRTAWYVVADDEGHTFTKPDNRGVFEVLAVQFLDSLR